jgi:hypothetical protein
MEFSAVLQTPIVETIDGQDVTLPLLTSKELAPLAEQIRNDRKKSAKALGESLKFDQVQHYRAAQEIDTTEIGVGDIISRVRSPAGAEQVIKLSAVKGGYTPEQSQAIADSLGLIRQVELAMAITRISKLPSSKVESDAVSRPLDASAASPTPTGSPSSPASAEVAPESTPAT